MLRIGRSWLEVELWVEKQLACRLCCASLSEQARVFGCGDTAGNPFPHQMRTQAFAAVIAVDRQTRQQDDGTGSGMLRRTRPGAEVRSTEAAA